MAKISQSDINVFRALVKNVREVFEEVSTKKENTPNKWITYPILFVSFVATLALLVLLNYGTNLVLHESAFLKAVFIPILGTCILVLILSKQIWLNRMQGGNFLFCFFGFVWLVSFLYVIGVCYLVLKYEFDISTGLEADPKHLLRSSFKDHMSDPSLGKIVSLMAAIMASTAPIIFGIHALPERKGHEFSLEKMDLSANDEVGTEDEDTRPRLVLALNVPAIKAAPSDSFIRKQFTHDETTFQQVEVGFVELYKEIAVLKATVKFMIDSLERFNVDKGDVRKTIIDIIQKSSIETKNLDEDFMGEVIAKVEMEMR